MFEALRIRSFRIYIIAQGISLIGTWMQMTAQQWLVWELTRSESLVALTSALGTLPLLFLVPFTGILADRMDRRKLLLISQIFATLLAVSLALYAWSAATAFWPVLLLSLLLGVSSALDFPTQSAFVGDLVGTDMIRKAVGLNATMFQLGRTVGPALAGIVVASTGTAPAFAINALSFMPLIIALLLVRSQQVRKTVVAGERVDLFAGVHWLRTQPRLLEMVFAAIIFAMFVFSAGSLFAPLASDVLGGDAATFGLVSSAAGIGALIGAVLLTPRMVAASRVGQVLLGSVAWSGVWLIVLALNPVLSWTLICVFMLNLTLPVVMAGTGGLVQFMAPIDKRARVVSAWQMLSIGASPVGTLIAGAVAGRFGVVTALVVNGVCILIGVSALALTRRELWRWRVDR